MARLKQDICLLFQIPNTPGPIMRSGIPMHSKWMISHSIDSVLVQLQHRGITLFWPKSNGIIIWTRCH